MSEIKDAATTNVVGYFNPQKYPIFVEISEINLKSELAPNAYIRDRQGNYINDPIFEDYVHPKGLGKSTSANPVPIRFAPRFVKATRPAAAVTQATGFVRQQDGRTVPTYAQPASTAESTREVAANKTPITGMSMEAARKMGLVGRPRLVPEDYGAPETSGAPSSKNLPEIKYSTESAPRRRTASPLRPPPTPEDLQKSLAQASTTPPDRQIADLPAVKPVRLKAPENPTPIAAAKPQPKSKPDSRQPVKKRVAQVMEAEPPPAARPIQPIRPRTEVETEQEVEAEVIEENAPAPGSGIVQPMDDDLPPPVLDNPTAEDSEKRFICAADGKPFKFRSELERHVRRQYPEMYDALMRPYPA